MDKSQFLQLNDEAWVRQRYVVEGASDTDIASEIGCHRQSVVRARERFGIKGRGKGRRLEHPELTRELLIAELPTKTMSEIARERGVSVQVVSGRCKRYGIARSSSRSVGVREALRKRFPEGRSGSSTANWKGGRSKRGSYWYLHRELVKERWPDHPRLALLNWSHCQEHILVMEAHVGRILQRGEDVHHGPGGKEDNRIENLTLMGSRGEHISEHWAVGFKAKQLQSRVAYLEGLLDAAGIPYEALGEEEGIDK